MIDPAPKDSHKKSVGNHGTHFVMVDNCDDCKRQKVENDALINIYQKLQDVQKKSFRVRNALQNHRDSLVKNRTIYKSLEERLEMIPSKKNKEDHQIEKLGFDIAAFLIERQKKSNLQKENLKLKAILAQMQSVQGKETTYDQINYNSLMLERKPSSKISKLNSTLKTSQQSSMNTKNIFYSCEIDNMERTMVSDRETWVENTSTHSSVFNRGQKKKMDLIKYNDLNLWLYQNEKNVQLEEDLYLTKEVKNRATYMKRTSTILPVLKLKK